MRSAFSALEKSKGLALEGAKFENLDTPTFAGVWHPFSASPELGTQRLLAL